MCLGTYVVSYSCGHTSYKNNVCLQDVDPHYRCEPRGMKITQPHGRCVECFSRDLAPHQHLTTTVRFNPDPSVAIEVPQPLSPRSSVASSASGRNDAIIRWVMEVPASPGVIRIEREIRQTCCSLGYTMSEKDHRHDRCLPKAHARHCRRFSDLQGYEADDDDEDESM